MSGSLRHRAARTPALTATDILLAGLFAQAVRDLYTLNPYDAPRPQALFQRFVGWSEPRFLPDRSPAAPDP